MRAEKQLLLDEIRDKIDGSEAFIVTQYQKLTPNTAAQFRSSLSRLGGSFEVVRKRIFLKALEASGQKISPDLLEGHVGIVFANKEPITIAKTLYQFSKENESIFKVLGGFFEGKICSHSDVKVISELPSKDEMRAQLLGLFEAVPSETVGVIQALLTSVMYCLDNKSQQ